MNSQDKLNLRNRVKNETGEVLKGYTIKAIESFIDDRELEIRRHYSLLSFVYRITSFCVCVVMFIWGFYHSTRIFCGICFVIALYNMLHAVNHVYFLTRKKSYFKINES